MTFSPRTKSGTATSTRSCFAGASCTPASRDTSWPSSSSTLASSRPNTTLSCHGTYISCMQSWDWESSGHNCYNRSLVIVAIGSLAPVEYSLANVS